MRLKFTFFLSVILLLFASVSRAELIDHRDSRRDYARSIASLQPISDGDSGASSQRRGLSYTLVLFRTGGKIPDFGSLEPDILVAGPHGCFTAAYIDQEKALAAIERLHTIQDVVYAELDGEVYACSGAAAQEEGNAYTFHSSGAGKMGFQEAAVWAQKAGEGSVLVAVIDSGVYPHAFLSSRLRGSGYDYVDNDGDATSDVFGHGTHVAGIIVDCTPDLPVYLRPIRVLNALGKGSTANTASAVFEAAEAGCDVINLSLVANTHSQALEDAILYALGCGTSVVISAGNSGDNTVRYCPVHMEEPGFLVVGACAGSMEAPVQAAYSNYGASVDVFAFGTSIQSCSLSGGYTVQTGTSQAAPHISALCAVIKLLFPSIGCQQIESRVKALSGDGEVNVPNAALLVPKTMGIEAEEIYLPVGTQIKLLQTAFPETAFLNISWSCEDESVALVNSEGILSCVSDGTTVLHGNGSARADVSVLLHVVQETDVFRLPLGIKQLEKEAFSGTDVRIIYLPKEIETIEEGVFDQTNLKTVFYHGHHLIFDNLHEGNNLCFIIRNDRTLYQHLNMLSLQYIINCSE